ncbi:MAG: hypothetical protein EBT64_03870 [Gammaproteobacteria bacterium]|nr:hypothetical protein [Gammaproteobacteria bacterium]
MRNAVSAISVDDSAIRTRIREDRARFGEIWCPHTAVAAEVWTTMPAELKGSEAWCVVSTASPAKFPEIVEPLIGMRVPIPETLARLFDRPSVFEEIDASLETLKGKLK